MKLKQFILDIFFPKFCINCNKEGEYICQNCFSLIDILEKQETNIFSATSYKDKIVRTMIHQFKYGHCIKELAKPLSILIGTHFLNYDKLPFDQKKSVLIPVPLHKKKLKQRGFNQSQELANNLSDYFSIPVLDNILIKTKQTLNQVELTQEQRKHNIQEVFSINNSKLIQNKTILLIDDVYTTGSTIKECSNTLKQANPKQIYGITVAKG